MGPPMEVMMAPEPFGSGATDRETEQAASGISIRASLCTRGA